MKNSNDTFGNRTRDLPACSTVPQPTGPQKLEVILSFARGEERFLLQFLLYGSTRNRIEGGKKAEGVCEHGVQENIWT